MLEQLARVVDAAEHPAPAPTWSSTVRDLSARELAPLVQKIDAEGYYPGRRDACVRPGRRVRAHLPGG